MTACPENTVVAIFAEGMCFDQFYWIFYIHLEIIYIPNSILSHIRTSFHSESCELKFKWLLLMKKKNQKQEFKTKYFFTKNQYDLYNLSMAKKVPFVEVSYVVVATATKKI